MALIVGNWPGAYSHNLYINMFCDSLEEAGLATMAITHPFVAAFQKIDVLHIHSPETVFWGSGRLRAGFLAALALVGLLLLKLKGVRIVWCVHDLEPHSGGSKFFRRLWRLYITVLTVLIDGFVTLSPSTVQIAREAIPGLSLKPATFIWHPEYIIERCSFDRSAWRHRNGIPPSAKIIALIGQIRPYKGVEELIDCFHRTTDFSLRLLLAGGPGSEEYSRTLDVAVANDKRILLKLGALSEEEFSSAVLAADLVVLPYRKIFHSGSMIYALSCRRPVLTPATPYATDILDQVGPRWMNVYRGSLTPDRLENFRTPDDEELNLDFLSIHESGSKIKEFYLSL